MRSANGRSASGRLTAWTAIPVRRSNVQGIPKPTASTSPPTASLASSTASTTASMRAAWSSPKASRRARWWTVSRSGSTAPARSFVPPRSTPITQRAGTSTTIPRSPWPKRSPTTPATARARSSSGSAPTARATGSTICAAATRGRSGGGKRKLRERFTFWRVLGYIALAAVGWVLVSLLLFLISAQVQRQKVNDAAGSTLNDSGFPLTSPNNDPRARLRRPHEGDEGARRQRRRPEPLGHDPADARRRRERSARLSIPRDTFAEIPGHGTDKINAAYATAARASRSRPSRTSSASRSTTSSRSTSRTSPTSSTRSAASTTPAAA